MEADDPEGLQLHVPILDDDFGSAYEASDTDFDPDEQSSSQNEELSHSPRTRPRKGGSEGVSRRVQGSSESDGQKSRDSSTASQREERRRAASKWAATFQEPQSPAQIKTPPRSARSKRKAIKSNSHRRAKRLRPWYNNEYRELLNTDIYDAAARYVSAHEEPLETSQIGCAIWTAEEKDLFFAALSKLGRDNVRAIASRVGTKSEPEVQEYIQLLNEGLLDEKSIKILSFADLPAAVDISEECCGILERAGEAVDSRQQHREEEAEEEKWGDVWLLNSNINKRLMKEADRKSVERVLPAISLFALGNWLELSHRIFMNSDTEDGNWETIAETDETPAIRATAFEDFHSLAVSITKRLVSATLFCTLARRRAMASNASKHADVNEDDVCAAAKILGLKTNSHDFWTSCARRCNLRVFDEEWNSFMSYEEVEESIRETPRQRWRSRSLSRHGRSVSRGTQSDAGQELRTDSEPESQDYQSDSSTFSNSSDASDAQLKGYLRVETIFPKSRNEKESLLQKAWDRKEAEDAYEAHVEAIDVDKGRLEEERLWTLLKQTAPVEIKSEPTDLPKPPRGTFRDHAAERVNWRMLFEFLSEWETLETPVPRAHFDRNRKRLSGRARRRARRALTERDGNLMGNEDLQSVAESDLDGNQAPDESPGDLVEQREEDREDEGHITCPTAEEVEELPVDSEDDMGETQHGVVEQGVEDGSEAGHPTTQEQVEEASLDPDEELSQTDNTVPDEHEDDGNNDQLSEPKDYEIPEDEWPLSPLFEDAGNFQPRSHNREDSDEDIRMKSEWDSS
jgi:hypothetical protein